MKRKAALYLTFISAVATALTFAQNQSILDLLRTIQPGQPANTQPAPAAAPQPSPSPAAPAAPSGPAPVLDTKPAFMSIATNYTLITNQIIVTNYVVVTNRTFTTNFYNAQGQLLMPLQPVVAPALAVVEAKPVAPTAPDPAVIRSNKVQAVRDLLSQALTGASNTLAVDGSFTRNPGNQIKIPDGVTVFDRKKGQTLTTAMNTAAEKAAPAAFAILQKLVAQLNPPDPAQILQGNSDAATRYLLSAGGQDAVNQILAAVQNTATDAHVPEAYNAVMIRGGGLLGAVLGTAPSVDINAHITRGLTEAIVLNVSSQENLIRTDPAARTTKTLKEAFAK